MKLKPCPCCGSDNIYHGPTAVLTQGIICCDCRLNVSRELPDEWPDEINSKGTTSQQMKRLEKYVLQQAAEAWNKRITG